MSDERHGDELVVCANCNARSRIGFEVPTGLCPGVDLGTTDHDWIDVGGFFALEPVTVQPQVTELDSAVTGDYTVRFSFAELHPNATVYLCLWGDAAEWDAPDKKITELLIPASALEQLVRAPERCRYAIDVGGTEVFASASLRRDGNPARGAERVELAAADGGEEMGLADSGCELCGTHVDGELELTHDSHPEGPNLLVCPSCATSTRCGKRNCDEPMATSITERGRTRSRCGKHALEEVAGVGETTAARLIDRYGTLAQVCYVAEEMALRLTNVHGFDDDRALDFEQDLRDADAWVAPDDPVTADGGLPELPDGVREGVAVTVSWDTPHSPETQSVRGEVLSIDEVEQLRGPVGTAAITVAENRDDRDLVVWPARSEVRATYESDTKDRALGDLAGIEVHGEAVTDGGEELHEYEVGITAFTHVPVSATSDEEAEQKAREQADLGQMEVSDVRPNRLASDGGGGR